MNSDASTPPLLSNPPSTLLIPPLNSSGPSFNDAPLETFLEKSPKDMTPQELSDYVKRCSLLRNSAQSRAAEFRKEEKELEAASGKPRKRKSPAKGKDNVAKAMEALRNLGL